ncbi:homeobox-domain-containing protein [Hymenopellis radicata]|nr:homeobox-domain-containing protein [Hymenopellis radicata]
MSHSRDYGLGRSKSPSVDSQTGFFQTGQGGRTVLPPLSSAFPTSHSTVPAYPQYSQRSSPGRYDYDAQYHGGQWQQSSPGSSYEYYAGQDGRYPSGYSMYPSNGPVDSRKLPPLNTNPGSGRDDRWATPYATSSMSGGHGIRSPTASYPASYNAYSSSTHAYGYNMAHDPTLMASHAVPSSYTPPPISPTSGNEDSPTIKKKRKRADAAQLKILNETYARTAFPSTEERLQLAKTLDMSARSVQIWFQNKRQSMRQTRQSSSSHQAFSLSPGEGDDMGSGYTSSPYVPRSSPEAHPSPSASHRRPRTDATADQRQQWSRGY